jgi:hypothetical protein
MSITNLGNQYITFDYRHPAKGSDFNTLLREGIKPGVYSGGDITITGGNTISIAPFVAYLNTGTDKMIRVETRSAVALTITESTPVLSITYTWQDVSEDWLDWNQRASGSAKITNEVCLGEMVFISNLIDSIDYSLRDYGLYINGQYSPDIIPVGSIVARVAGYFGDNSNGSYTDLALALPSNWKVCDGSLCNDVDSPIFNGTGRYLPNLTDSRFIMGSTVALSGVIGGNTGNQVTLITENLPNHNHTNTHTHTFSGSTGAVSADHSHTMTLPSWWGATPTSNAGWGGDNGLAVASATNTTSGVSANHTHAYSGTTSSASAQTGYTGSGTAFSILPKYLTAPYIMRIK